ncbi:TPA: hypothetical protein ACGXM3_005210 [Bacillus cereus]
MLTYFKNRVIEESQKVNCFWNLHLNVFSLEGRTMENGAKKNLVLAHGNNIILLNVKFTVRESGRQKVLREQKKNVHAFVKGNFMGIAGYNEKLILGAGMREAYYNPYKQDSFTDKETGKKLEGAGIVILADKRIYYK